MVTQMHVGFKVEDYEKWKAGYDASVEQRKAAGEISFQVFRNVDDSIAGAFSSPPVVSLRWRFWYGLCLP